MIEETNACAANKTNGLIENLFPLDCLKGNEDNIWFLQILSTSKLLGTKIWTSYTLNTYSIVLPSQKQHCTSPFSTNHRYVYHFYVFYNSHKILKISYQTSRFDIYFFLSNEVYGLNNLLIKLKPCAGFFSRQLVMCIVYGLFPFHSALTQTEANSLGATSA